MLHLQKTKGFLRTQRSGVFSLRVENHLLLQASRSKFCALGRETSDWPGIQDTLVLGVRILWVHSSVWGDRTPLAETKSD